MANKKISALTELTAVAYNDYLAIVDTTAGSTKKISMNNLVYSYVVVAGIANLGTGRTDGELKITADEYGNRYTWDNDNSKWRIHSGNMYITTGLPASASYTMETGAVVYDVTTGGYKYWNGSAWTALFTPSNICRIKTGTYTGDGSTGQAITGVGFQPKYVKIWKHPASDSNYETIEKLDVTWADYAFEHGLVAANEHRFRVDKINSLDADGFTVDDGGGDYYPNANGVVYDYLALG